MLLNPIYTSTVYTHRKITHSHPPQSKHYNTLLNFTHFEIRQPLYSSSITMLGNPRDAILFSTDRCKKKADWLKSTHNATNLNKLPN